MKAVGRYPQNQTALTNRRYDRQGKREIVLSSSIGVSYMRYATAVIAVLAAFACTESSALTIENYSGVYTLTLVNGKDFTTDQVAFEFHKLAERCGREWYGLL